VLTLTDMDGTVEPVLGEEMAAEFSGLDPKVYPNGQAYSSTPNRLLICSRSSSE
jgi:hypothetical protein